MVFYNSFAEKNVCVNYKDFIAFNYLKFDINFRSRQAKSSAVKKVGEAVKALALCHNVTPVREGKCRTIVKDVLKQGYQTCVWASFRI